MGKKSHKACYVASVASLAALIVLCVAWELWLAPLRPGGSWMALKALPLLVPLRGVLKRDLYIMQWSSMLILLYFIEGIVRATSVVGIDRGLSSTLAWVEVGLVTVFFFSTIFYLHPYKQAAKKLAQQAIQKASK
ncbi:MAG TPA: DUF2069 domain-containing protein [Burkholderiaceae bacterium]|jgi:uncharacterized membrane protein|nr:DUF2069 domain-containing protein [Burkholderiaceae bacterium]